jgi:hypothetical protein
MRGRSNTGASEEYRIIATNLHDPYHFNDFIKSSFVSGVFYSVYSHMGQEVIFGKKLVNAYQHFLEERVSLVHSDFLLPDKPEKMYHLDSCGKSEAEGLLSLSKGYLKDCKADLITKNNLEGLRFYSVKKGGNATKKLGQISRYVKFGSVPLGGLFNILENFNPSTPDDSEIMWEDTCLKKTSYDLLKGKGLKKDKRACNSPRKISNLQYAWFKKNSLAWKYIDRIVCMEGESMLRNFYDGICVDRKAFVEFIIYLVRGPNSDPDLINSFYFLIGGRVFSLLDLYVFLSSGDYHYSCRWHTNNAFFIDLEYRGRVYCLMRIQAAFDGAGADRSQTKGIVFYAQDYPSGGSLRFWDLLEDIPKNVP